MFDAVRGVGHVAHGGLARGGGVAPAHRFGDGAVLVVHLHHVAAVQGFVGARHLHGVALVLLQKAQQAFVVWVVGGAGDAAVKAQVGLDAGRAHGRAGLQFAQRVHDRARLLGCDAPRGQLGHVGLQAAAHLHHLQHGLHGVQHRRVEGQGARLVAGRHEHARALARGEQADGLELADGLAHHRARHAELLGQALLRGQALVGFQLARLDALHQQGRQPVGQALRCLQGLGVVGGHACLGLLCAYQVIIQI